MRIYGIFAMMALLFLSACENKQEIITTSDIAKIHGVVSQLDPGDLAIFDCDDVLSFNPYFTTTGAISIIPLFNRIKAAENVGTTEKAETAMSILLKESKCVPVNRRMPKIVEIMQRNGVKTLVLTQLGAGSYGEIKSLAEWRIGSLTNMGYTFSNAWNNLKNTSFDDARQKITFPRVVIASPDTPHFIDGVLFAGGVQKQEVVGRFLQYAGEKPKKMLFIDDIKKNVVSMGQFARSLGMAYVGIHYTAVEDLKYSKECVEAVQQAKTKIDSLYPAIEEKS